MNFTEKQKKSHEMLNTIYQKCWDDKGFIKKLESSPNETLDILFKRTTNSSKNLNIVVEDQTDTSIIYFNLPAKPNYESMELSDEQLELVSGGEVGFLIAGGSIIAGFTVAYVIDNYIM